MATQPRTVTHGQQQLECTHCGQQYTGSVTVDRANGEAVTRCPSCGKQQEPKPRDG